MLLALLKCVTESWEGSRKYRVRVNLDINYHTVVYLKTLC